jgi:hypothetical protein
METREGGLRHPSFENTRKGDKRMKNNERYYLAYGSNLNVLQMEHRCPGSEIVGKSFIEGYHLLYKGSGTGFYLTIEKMKGRMVPVAVWKITKEDEKRLDSYEGFPFFYYKKGFTLDVKTVDGVISGLPCFAYIMHETRSAGIPTVRYTQICEQGYRDFGFDPMFLKKAYSDTFREIRRRNLTDGFELF